MISGKGINNDRAVQARKLVQNVLECFNNGHDVIRNCLWKFDSDVSCQIFGIQAGGPVEEDEYFCCAGAFLTDQIYANSCCFTLKYHLFGSKCGCHG